MLDSLSAKDQDRLLATLQPEEFGPALEDRVRNAWSKARVAEMATDAIAERLCSFGIQHTRERFEELAKQRPSAEAIADAWRSEDPVTCSGWDEDFLVPAAMVLWERYLPDCVTVEILDDWMQEGYRLLHAENDRPGACDIWWRTWRAFVDHILPPDVRSLEAADGSFTGSQFVSDWVQDFELELQNATSLAPAYASMGSKLCEEWLARFPETTGLTECNFRRSRAEFLFVEGHVERGLEILHDIVRRYPKSETGYLALGDAFAHVWGDAGPPKDIAAAVRFWEQGVVACKQSRDRLALEDRLAEFRPPA